MVKHNSVLITIESLRSDFVGYHNPKESNTPFLDKLSKESFVYKNAIAPGIPTFFHFPSLMTGKSPFTYGYKLGIDEAYDNKTIAEVLKQNGYRTIAVLGDNPQLYSLYNFNRGFDIYLDGFDRSKSDLFVINALWNIKQRVPAKLGQILDYIRATIRILSGSRPPHIPGKDLNKIAISELSKNSKEPFFLWIHYMDIHFPYLSGIDKIHGTLKKIIYYKKLMKSVTNMKIEDPKLVELVRQAYRGCIEQMDEALEKLYESISAKYPNTIFIITSDHGEAFMEHGMFCHEALALYDELIKVPLLIHFPSKKKKMITEVVSTVSLAKTICSLLNIKNDTFDGTDLTKDGKDESINHISRILYKCISPSIRFQIFDNKTQIKGFNELVSYTTSDYKYIVERGGTVEELYNLGKDPSESENIINKTPKKIVNKFRDRLGKI